MSARKDQPSAGADGSYRILLVDDHPLVREGLAEVLQREPDLCICGEAVDCHGALEAIRVTRPDLAIVDLALRQSSGLELIKDIRACYSRVRVLVVSMQDEMVQAERALRAGACGYITKEEAAASVVQAVRQALRGEVYVSHRVAAHLATRWCGRPGTGTRPILESLTDRELQVFELIGEGFSRQQIAARLHLDVSTVETYRARLKCKLQVKDAVELLQCAIRSNRARSFRG